MTGDNSNESNDTAEIPFTKQMRQATQAIHSISDTMINAKLVIALSDESVWATGLYVFYQVFKFLEGAMDRMPDSLLARLDFPAIRRTELFEKDLAYYLGDDWRSGHPARESLDQYLAYLEHLETTEPTLLLPYAYHLYMGLLTGGQVIRRQRAMVAKLKFSSKQSYEGLAVTEITGISAYNLKKQIREEMEAIASELDDDTRAKIIEEGKKVFEMNNRMVQSIEGTGAAVMWKLMRWSSFAAIVGCVAYLLSKRLF